MGGVFAALTVLAAIVGWGVAWLLRQRARRIERGDAAVPDKVHALQRLAVAGSFGMLLIFAGGMAAFFGLAGRADDTSPAWLVVAIVAEFALLAALFVSGRAVRPSLARVRDVPVKPRRQRRAALLMLPVWIVLGAAMGAGFHFVPSHGLGRAASYLGMYAALLLVLQVIVGPLLIVKAQGRPLPASTVERLERLARDMDVRSTKLRGFDGRERKVANALQAGVLPGLRYVLVSDYLADNVSEAELDAVVAHEFGHVRGKHLLIKLGAILVCWIAFGALYLALGGGSGGSVAPLAFLPLLVGLPAGLLLVNGLIGVRLEQRADDAAVAAVGAGPVIAALDRLADLNDTKRNTGRGWALVTQHPGLDDRIGRLRERAGVAGHDVPAG